MFPASQSNLNSAWSLPTSAWSPPCLVLAREARLGGQGPGPMQECVGDILGPMEGEGEPFRQVKPLS
jgi:hypothetical protein